MPAGWGVCGVPAPPSPRPSGPCLAAGAPEGAWQSPPRWGEGEGHFRKLQLSKVVETPASHGGFIGCTPHRGGLHLSASALISVTAVRCNLCLNIHGEYEDCPSDYFQTRGKRWRLQSFLLENKGNSWLENEWTLLLTESISWLLEWQPQLASSY